MTRRGEVLGLAAVLLLASVAAGCATRPAPKPLLAPDGVTQAPLAATFIAVKAEPTPVDASSCRSVIINAAEGSFAVGNERLQAGDSLVARGRAKLELAGDGLAFVASVSEPCGKEEPTSIVVLRADAAPPLMFAKGAMEAHLDGETILAPKVYFGRLAGTAPVAEHRHEGSWEILGAVEGRGTFMVNGSPYALGPRTVIAIPPNTPHSWAPEAGVRLVAFQLYLPAGPEQRFKGLASAAPPDAGR